MLWLVLVLAYAVSAQFVMLPPNVKFGKVNMSGTWVYGSTPSFPVTARLAYDREVGSASRLIINTANPPQGAFPVVATYLRYLSNDPVLVETFIEAGDGEGGQEDTCSQQLLSGENFQCPDWKLIGNGTVDGVPVDKYRRICNVIEGNATITFRYEVDTDPQHIPVVVISMILEADFTSTLTLSRVSSNTQKPPANTWAPPASCRPQ